MIREAIEYIVGLGNRETFSENGQTYVTGDVRLLKEPLPAEIEVSTLSALVHYAKSQFDGEENFLIHVVSPAKVRLMSSLNLDAERSVWVEANALLPKISYGSFYDVERFNILLQSCFVKNEDKDILLKVVGNIKEEAVNNVGDDGISQTVTARAGVANIAEVAVPNPALLAPYRTFVDVEQPESSFVFRMQSGGPACGLFEADGGAWRNEAMDNIRDYLTENLAEEIESGNIHILS
ncbi:hypothetical protein SAMN04487943_101334 [Gracilibacillus orientalis]|uniref:Phage-related protein n=1 Tax=Gracilibacillus orientalis TaxID=334253 RepID=A0A1I4HB49_9BACI|nr:hypothetical protein [Gracilibacillus orientalis]SFL39512.1 hypothetical protein SAMN04487943_101334 [Gracilibacillus orientalis]